MYGKEEDMSRIGKNVIVMPAGVTAKFENNILTVNPTKRFDN